MTRHREGLNLSVEAHTKKTSVVIICNHKDEKWRTLLEEYLRVFEVDVWIDRVIGVGEDWHEKIKDALRNAAVAVLLISPDFLGSEFIRIEEVPRLLERHEGGELRIVPIIVQDCPWQQVEWLSRLQVFPRGGKQLAQMKRAPRETELKSVVMEVARIIKLR